MAKRKTECPVPSGILVIIGGSENKGEEKPEKKEKPDEYYPLEILKDFIQLIRKPDPIIEIITTASSEPAEAFQDYKRVFKKLGVTQLNHMHHYSRKELLADDLDERIKAADAFFFTGGDQLKLTSIYGGSHFLTKLKQRYISERIVIAGTSAGAMALSTPMIIAGSKEVEEIRGAIEMTTGLEFLKDVCIDTHFVTRGRFVRMAQVIVTNPSSIGIGIEEDTAIIVRNGTEAEVVGSGLIIIIDGFHIGDSNILEYDGDKKPITIRDLKMHILGCREKYTIPQANPPHV